MSNHYLEAYINKKSGPGFRLICEDPKTCRSIEGNKKGCVYVQSFMISGTLDMVGWPDNFEHVFGRIELRLVASQPLEFPLTGV